ncbi:MAG: hypothetical protein GX479_01525 [Bacteroidales bacterium]|nr:hypothetical protein [Bacteroidales bacterium]
MSIASWNLKEAGGKILPRGTRIAYRHILWDKTAEQVKVQRLYGQGSVNAAGIWEESYVPYHGRSHGRMAKMIHSMHHSGVKLAVRSQQKP